LPLFDEDESPCEPPGEATRPPESTRKKRRGGRKGLSADLPRQTIYLRLSEEEKAGAIETFFVKVKEELDITPAKVQVLEYLQEKAVFVEVGTRRLVEAERPRHPLGKAAVSVAFLAYLIVAKYCDALPLYRLEGIFTRYGGSVTRTTLAQWLIQLSLQLQPLINLMRDEQLTGEYLQGDETRLQVLKEPGLKATSHKWMWIMRGGPPDRPIVLFEYDRSRGKAVAERLLEDFSGRYFQSDGYSSYDAICRRKGIIHLGCWDHARRKFVEAEKGQPPGSATVRRSYASEALDRIRTLYRIEREIEPLPVAEKYRQRQLRSIPALHTFHTWLQENAPKLAKGGLTRDAIDYTLHQWPKLIRYCENGILRISNILAENNIRPVALGRKAWLFADTPAGARASAIYFSLVETAKANGLEPYDYLCRVLRQIPYAQTIEDWEALLPWNMK
jgi:transposase